MFLSRELLTNNPRTAELRYRIALQLSAASQLAISRLAVSKTSVMLSRSTKRTAATFALVAMLMVQLAGGITRYYCDCTGHASFTLEEHCHGEHGEEGPLDHAPIGHQHHDDDQDEVPAETPDTHHHHELVKTPTDAVPPVLASAPVVTLPVIHWIEISDLISLPQVAVRESAVPPPIDSGQPQQALIVVRSVVFLI